MNGFVIHEFGPRMFPSNTRTCAEPAVPKPGEDPDQGPRRDRQPRYLDVKPRAGKETRRRPTLPAQFQGRLAPARSTRSGPAVTPWLDSPEHHVGCGRRACPLATVPDDCTNYDGPQAMMSSKRPGVLRPELVCVPPLAWSYRYPDVQSTPMLPRG